jgi:hypothetical protein
MPLTYEEAEIAILQARFQRVREQFESVISEAFSNCLRIKDEASQGGIEEEVIGTLFTQALDKVSVENFPPPNLKDKLL